MRRPLVPAESAREVTELVRGLRLHSVCQEALCPNRPECFGRKTATFLVGGVRCTRDCRYCAVEHGLPPLALNPDEPRRIAEAAGTLGLRYVVLTGVSRDDLADGGASHYGSCVRAIRALPSAPAVEILVPDFQGRADSIRIAIESRPDVLNCNLETVRRLYPSIRPQGRYEWPLSVLEAAAAAGLATKSGIILGLGETPDDVREALRDLRAAGATILTLGQYLRPSEAHAEVARFVSPAEFDAWRTEALAMGFREACCGPFVRSSYRAHEVFERARSR